MKVLGWILKKNRGWVGLSLAAAFLSNTSQIIYMFFVGELVNKIETRTRIEGAFFLLMGAFLISNGLTQYLNQLTNRYTAEKTAHTLRMGFIRAQIQKGNGTDNTSAAPSELMSKVQNELNSANTYLSSTFFDMLGMSLSGILAFISLMIMNIKLTLVILIPNLIIMAYVLLTGDKLSKLVSATQEEKSRMNKISYSAIDHNAMIRVYDGKEFLLGKFQKSLDAWGVAETKRDRMYAIYNSLSGVLSCLPLLLLLLAGCYMVLTGEILLGTLIMFLNLQSSVNLFIMNMPTWLAGFRTFTTNLSRIEVR